MSVTLSEKTITYYDDTSDRVVARETTVEYYTSLEPFHYQGSRQGQPRNRSAHLCAVISNDIIFFEATTSGRTSETTPAQVRDALIAAGLSLPPPNTPPPGKLTTEQRAALARRLSGARPMSDLISEDREGR